MTNQNPISRLVQSVFSSSSNEAAKWERLSEGGGGVVSHGSPQTYAGRRVTPDAAMQLSAFWACVRITAQAFSTMPFHFYEKRPDGSRVRFNGNAVSEILTVSPNRDQTVPEFWEQAVAWMLVQGNSYFEKRYIGDRLASLEPISEHGVEPKRDRDGNLLYQFQDRGKVERLPPDRVFHLRAFGFDKDKGASVLKHGIQSISSAMAADEASGKLFSNGLSASGILTTEQSLKTEQRTALQKIMDKFTGSKNAGKMMILEAGLKYNQITMNPEDAQLLETRRFNIEEICRWTGTPPIMVGHAADGQTMWGSGVEQIVLAWLALGINPLANKIQARISKQLLNAAERRRYYGEFNREALIQMDSNAKQRFLGSLVNNGLMTRNEGRGYLNLPAKPGGDDLTVQTALTPIEQLASAISDNQKG